MNWKNFWNNQALARDPYQQVARLGGKGGHNEEQLTAIAAHVSSLLQLNGNDVLLDVCCGNGLLTSKLSSYCRKITGVDFSENLIDRAKELYPHITFVCGDATVLSRQMFAGHDFTKISLYFSFQYFETPEKGRQVIKNLLALLPPDGMILLGDIPDRAHFFRYYNSSRKLIQLAKQMLLGKNDMGKFWSEEELDAICRQLGATGKKLSQPRDLPYAHYRMDYLIVK